jgi:hypothetical protein
VSGIAVDSQGNMYISGNSQVKYQLLKFPQNILVGKEI